MGYAWNAIVNYGGGRNFVTLMLETYTVPLSERGRLRGQKFRYKGMNEHLRPFWAQCGMCKYKFKYIAKVETLSDDLEYIFRKVEFGLTGPKI